MKIALLGSGKTGGKISEIHSETIVFNQKNKPTVEALKECEVIISFLPGEAFLSYLDIMIDSGLPVITGSTGFDWPEDLDLKLKEKKLHWVYANNFSLGMSLVKTLIESLGEGADLFKDPTFSIHDIHHKKKLDSPSGTALSWRKWLGHSAKITSERTGDVVGEHQLEMKTENESIKLTHEAKDRTIFASGALWSANQILSNTNLPFGLIHFNDVVIQHLKKDH